MGRSIVTFISFNLFHDNLRETYLCMNESARRSKIKHVILAIEVIKGMGVRCGVCN